MLPYYPFPTWTFSSIAHMLYSGVKRPWLPRPHREGAPRLSCRVQRAASSGESTSVVADRLAQERLGGQHAVQKHPQRLQA